MLDMDADTERRACGLPSRLSSDTPPSPFPSSGPLGLVELPERKRNDDRRRMLSRARSIRSPNGPPLVGMFAANEVIPGGADWGMCGSIVGRMPVTCLQNDAMAR